MVASICHEVPAGCYDKGMKTFTELPRLQAGDQVAILSPSSGLPEVYPDVYELGLERLHGVFGLEPKEYPTTRVLNAPLQDRARDLMAAFADPDVKAVIASIGGNDQLKLLKYLDAKVFRDNPKPFLGFSDNTHFMNYLWNLGIPSFYGGSIMTQFAFHGQMTDMTVRSIRHALFTGGETGLEVTEQYNDIGLDWSDPANLVRTRQFEPNDGLFWDGSADAEGRLWGGCVESLIFQSTTGIYLPKDEDLDDTILFLETAEDIPEHWIINYLLTGFGERGWFDRIRGVFIGRPKAWERDKPHDAEWKAAYRAAQRQTVLRAVRTYNPTIPVVQNLDFGHTDPQVLIPMGNKARIDAAAQKIYLTY